MLIEKEDTFTDCYMDRKDRRVKKLIQRLEEIDFPGYRR